MLHGKVKVHDGSFLALWNKVCNFISVMTISSTNPMSDHLLESSHRDDSNKWSYIGFSWEIDIIEIKISTLSGALHMLFFSNSIDSDQSSYRSPWIRILGWTVWKSKKKFCIFTTILVKFLKIQSLGWSKMYYWNGPFMF